MRFLFVHQNFPGQYLHVAARLAAGGEHQVVFVSEPNAGRIPGVRRAVYRPLRSSTPGLHQDAADFESAMIRAQSVERSCGALDRLGFRPDIVVGHNGWGELLRIKDVWPAVPLLGYFEFYYRLAGADVGFDPEFPLPDEERPRIRARNAVNLLGLELCDAGHSPTEWQRGTYPDWARARIRHLPEGVDTARCRPDPAASFALPDGRSIRRGEGPPLVTYVARNLEPYRGFHMLMRALPALLAACPEAEVVLAGGDEVSYGTPPRSGGTWRQRMLDELGGSLNLARVHFVGTLPHAEYVSLLQVSAVHVYLTYPFVASWSLREALACGCCVVASDTGPVREFVEDGANGRLVAFHDPAGLAAAVAALLEDRAAAMRLGRAAAARAVDDFSLEVQQGRLLALVRELRGGAA